jgi:hypothetical protein
MHNTSFLFFLHCYELYILETLNKFRKNNIKRNLDAPQATPEPKVAVVHDGCNEEVVGMNCHKADSSGVRCESLKK